MDDLKGAGGEAAYATNGYGTLIGTHLRLSAYPLCGPLSTYPMGVIELSALIFPWVYQMDARILKIIQIAGG